MWKKFHTQRRLIKVFLIPRWDKFSEALKLPLSLNCVLILWFFCKNILKAGIRGSGLILVLKVDEAWFEAWWWIWPDLRPDVKLIAVSLLYKWPRSIGLSCKKFPQFPQLITFHYYEELETVLKDVLPSCLELCYFYSVKPTKLI